MTQDGYLGRKIRNPLVVQAMDEVLGTDAAQASDDAKGGEGVA